MSDMRLKNKMKTGNCQLVKFFNERYADNRLITCYAHKDI